MSPVIAAALIGVSGSVLVAVAAFWASVRNTRKTTELTLRAVELAEQGQVTDRYTRAIEQLGSENLDVRIGGIYGLERVAHDSPRDHSTVMEVLAAFIRERSLETWQSGVNSTHPDRMTRPDVQAAATVIGRRAVQHDSQRIDLAQTKLPRVNLADANLASADFFGADLYNANLVRADLSGAILISSNLRIARLADAKLTSAILAGVDMTYAIVNGADLTDADLNGAIWPEDKVPPEGWLREPDSGSLKRAASNSDGALPASST
jgi:uncharacterized protein YjbI with pentapeptide repeats